MSGLVEAVYPVERNRLDIFTRFLDPSDIEPAQVRTSELTVMMMQLLASGRGVRCLPNWAVHEYSSRGYATAKRLGEKGYRPSCSRLFEPTRWKCPM